VIIGMALMLPDLDDPSPAWCQSDRPSHSHQFMTFFSFLARRPVPWRATVRATVTFSITTLAPL
jgi:hypothetical protein